MELLRFCSERTELFVPAAQEGAYCFFHRSFFEYFYAKYTARLKTPREIVREFKKFDIDSEVFELTAALLKNDDESLYQDLVQYIIDQAETDIKNRKREHYARQIQHLSDMGSEQLKQITDLLFYSS